MEAAGSVDEDSNVDLIKDYMHEEGIKNLNPDLLAIQLISNIEGFYMYRVVHGDSPDLDQAAESFKQDLWKTLEGGQES